MTYTWDWFCGVKAATCTNLKTFVFVKIFLSIIYTVAGSYYLLYCSALGWIPQSLSLCIETCDSVTASLCLSGLKWASDGEDDDSIKPCGWLHIHDASMNQVKGWGLFMAKETPCKSSTQRALSTIISKERPFQQFDEKYMFKYTWVTVTGQEKCDAANYKRKKRASGALVFSWNHLYDKIL